MEKQYKTPTSHFSEIIQDDVDLWCENAAKAEDRALGALINIKATSPKDRGVVLDNEANDTKLLSWDGVNEETFVAPIRAFVGSASDSRYDARGIYFGGGNVETAAPVSGFKWYLVYAKLTVEQPVEASGVATKVKAADTGQVTEETLYHQYQHTCAVGAVAGTLNSDTLPTVPADTATEFYITLGYVRASDAGVTNNDMFETARVLSVMPSVGGVDCAPANQQYVPGGTVATAIPWDGSETVAKPECFMPSTMVGRVERLIALDLMSTTKSHASESIVDNSIDWSNRIFKYTAVVDAGATAQFAWAFTEGLSFLPSVGMDAPMQQGVGQSFVFITGEAVAALFEATTAPIPGLNVDVTLYVDESDGSLRVKYASDPGARVFVWLEATGRIDYPIVVGT